MRSKRSEWYVSWVMVLPVTHLEMVGLLSPLRGAAACDSGVNVGS